MLTNNFRVGHGGTGGPAFASYSRGPVPRHRSPRRGHGHPLPAFDAVSVGAPECLRAQGISNSTLCREREQRGCGRAAGRRGRSLCRRTARHAVDRPQAAGGAEPGAVSTRPPGIVLHYNTLVPDELACLRGITVTTPARTAFDLGRRAGLTRAVIGLDALMRATRITTADVRRVAEQHHGARGHRAAARGARPRRSRRRVTSGDADPSRPRQVRVAAGAHPDRRVRPVRLPRRSRGHGLGDVEGRRRVRRRAALGRSPPTFPRHRPHRGAGGSGLADHPRQRRDPPHPSGHHRSAHAMLRYAKRERRCARRI